MELFDTLLSHSLNVYLVVKFLNHTAVPLLLFLHAYVCYVCMNVHVCEHICTCVHICVWRLQVDVTCLHQFLYALFMEAGSLAEP